MCILVTTVLLPNTTWAKSSFRQYELKSTYSELLFSDLDGDGLDDIIVIKEPNLAFFFQDGKKGFTKAPNLIYSLGDSPSVIWPAKLRKNPGHSILVMSYDGVSALTLADKTSPPSRNNIINRHTIIPAKCENPSVVNFRFSANTVEESLLIFVPTEDKLEIWKYDKEWRHAYSLQGTPDTSIWGPYKTAGYTKQYWLNLNVSDLNGDGLEDIVICEENNGKTLFKIYPQLEEGAFAQKPSQSFEDNWDWRTWTCFQDINKDGKVDIIKNKWLEEPWFFPGTYSGKVLVNIFISDADGKIPDRPTFLFRKNDWIPSIPIVDVDGDGFIDLILGYSLFDSREGVRKSLTAKKFDHNLRIHFYNNGFRKQPDCQKDIAVQVGYRNILISGIAQRNFLETQITFEGDFNGDGNKDLLVKDRENKASVYFFISRIKGFSKKPNIQFNNIRQVEQFITNDLNKDGISDLVVLDGKKNSFSVFLSKRK